MDSPHKWALMRQVFQCLGVAMHFHFQFEGDPMDIPAGGFAPIQNIHIMKQELFMNVHMVQENIDIRWDGGQSQTETM